MRRYILLLGAIVLSGCAVDGEPRKKPSIAEDLGCDDKFQITISAFGYGESFMAILPLSKVRENSAFIIKLKPTDGFDDATVIVEGVGDTGAWIEGDGAARDLDGELLFVGCAPELVDDAEPAKFTITVQKDDTTNVLDPRALIVR
jgi:hypothetical protein